MIIQLILDGFHHIDRNRETYAHIPSGSRIEGWIDAHDFAMDIQERTAWISGVDGGVGLNEIFIVVNTDSVSSFGTDYADRHRLA